MLSELSQAYASFVAVLKLPLQHAFSWSSLPYNQELLRLCESLQLTGHQFTQPGLSHLPQNVLQPTNRRVRHTRAPTCGALISATRSILLAQHESPPCPPQNLTDSAQRFCELLNFYHAPPRTHTQLPSQAPDLCYPLYSSLPPFAKSATHDLHHRLIHLYYNLNGSALQSGLVRALTVCTFHHACRSRFSIYARFAHSNPHRSTPTSLLPCALAD